MKILNNRNYCSMSHVATGGRMIEHLKDSYRFVPPVTICFKNFSIFRIHGWFNAVAEAAGTPSPRAIEKFCKPRCIYQGDYGKVVTNAFYRYRNGVRKPSRKTVDTVEQACPRSAEFANHPLWSIIAAKQPTTRMLEAMLRKLDASTADYYKALIAVDSSTQSKDFLYRYCHMMLLHRREYWAALDHLAVNLIILRVQSNQLYCTSRLNLCWNIAQTLEPLSSSPWFRGVYENFFDHLEQLIWEELFDEEYSYDRLDDILSCDEGCVGNQISSEMKRGWRKAQYNWTCNTI